MSIWEVSVQESGLVVLRWIVFINGWKIQKNYSFCLLLDTKIYIQQIVKCKESNDIKKIQK